MYEVFANLCEEKNVTPYRVAKECGFSNVTLSDWKNKGNMPKADKLLKISRFLDVSIEFLMTGEDSTLGNSIHLSAEETAIITAYRRVNDITKDNICLLLGVKRDSVATYEERMA